MRRSGVAEQSDDVVAVEVFTQLRDLLTADFECPGVTIVIRPTILEMLFVMGNRVAAQCTSGKIEPMRRPVIGL